MEKTEKVVLGRIGKLSEMEQIDENTHRENRGKQK